MPVSNTVRVCALMLRSGSDGEGLVPAVLPRLQVDGQVLDLELLQPREVRQRGQGPAVVPGIVILQQNR